MNPVLSFTKGGAIYVPPCNYSQPLFPLEIPPSSWSSCNDAGEYTWSIQQDDLSAISYVDRLKLARSMGFCPQNRCQLGNLTNARNDDNQFNSGSLIGFYDKTQHAPKPIYKKSRIILGDEVGGSDESYESFINANQIHPSIIATQCPLSNTVGDVLRMLVEQNISLWIQLAPFVDPSDPDSTGQCKMNPTAFAHASRVLNNSEVSIQNIQQVPNAVLGLQQPTFSAETYTVQYTFSSHQGDNHIRIQNVTNVWYNNWKDFATPAEEDEADIMAVVDHTVQTIRRGGRVLVSCLSGRGRSGTFSALVIGKLNGVTTHSQLVDIIVSMRERRDGMLETPAQFRFVSRLLGLPSTADCGMVCKVAQHVAEHESFRLLIALVCGALLVLLPVLFVLRKSKI